MALISRWQAMADAAVFYLLTSTHSAAAASTSIFGLATWHDYHYYYGHVMWDIETFIVPVLSLLQPGAAESILEFRWRSIAGAASNARLRGRRVFSFPGNARLRAVRNARRFRAPLPGTKTMCRSTSRTPLRFTPTYRGTRSSFAIEPGPCWPASQNGSRAG